MYDDDDVIATDQPIGLLAETLGAAGQAKREAEAAARYAAEAANDRWSMEHPEFAGGVYLADQRAAEQAEADRLFAEQVRAEQDAVLADPGYPQEHRDAIIVSRLSPQERAEFLAARHAERQLARQVEFAEWLDPHARQLKAEREAAAGRAQIEGLHAQLEHYRSSVAARRRAFHPIDDGPSAA